MVSTSALKSAAVIAAKFTRAATSSRGAVRLPETWPKTVAERLSASPQANPARAPPETRLATDFFSRFILPSIRPFRTYEELNTETLRHREENEGYIKISFVFRRFPILRCASV